MATQRFSYTDSNTIPQAISTMVEQLDPMQGIMPKLLGFGMGNVSKFEILNWPNSTKLEWLTDTENPKTTTLNDSGGISDSDTTIVVTDAIFNAGDIIQIGSEYIRITAVSGTSLTTVASGSEGRGYGDTTPAAHADGATVTLLYPAVAEGGSFPQAYTTTTSLVYNYPQILRYKMSVTGTRAVTKDFKSDDEMAYQLAKLWNNNGEAGKAVKDFEDTYFKGKRVGPRSSSLPGSMGGFKTFVTSHVDSDGGDITLPRFESMLRDIADDGGTVEYIMGGSFQIARIASWFDGYRTLTADSKLGGFELEAIRNQFMPPIKLLYNYRCPSDEVHLINTNNMGWVPIREWTTKPLPTANDAEDMGLVGEYTFVVRSEHHMGYFSGLSTS